MDGFDTIETEVSIRHSPQRVAVVLGQYLPVDLIGEKHGIREDIGYRKTLRFLIRPMYRYMGDAAACWGDLKKLCDGDPFPAAEVGEYTQADQKDIFLYHRQRQDIRIFEAANPDSFVNPLDAGPSADLNRVLDNRSGNHGGSSMVLPSTASGFPAQPFDYFRNKERKHK